MPIQTIDDDEYERILKARQRLARREVELRQIIRYCNGEMDMVREKLCKDLEVMEILKGEIEQAGTGPMREQLEQDFHDGMTLFYSPALILEYIAYVATLTKQKEQVEELQERKSLAMKELEGITWSDQLLERKAAAFQSGERTL
jgi:hypothetical protein